jgi:hypothetical protein
MKKAYMRLSAQPVPQLHRYRVSQSSIGTIGDDDEENELRLVEV